MKTDLKNSNNRILCTLPYREKFGIPRQPNLVQVESYIEMTSTI